MPKQWMPAPPLPDDDWLAGLDMPPLIIATLYNRGLRSAVEMQEFVSGDPSAGLHDPFALKDMQVALERVQLAIARGEKIAVFADFDVDGVCSAVILEQTLRALDAHVEVYIPHRVEEGYGLNKDALSRLAERGVRLLITADCGTGSIAEVDHANSLGMHVIITDHHHVHSTMPAAVAMLNPHRPDCPYPFKDLAGAGVAYKLADALLAQADGRARAQSFLDLAALGTIVDVAPLVGENRALARLGLAAMRRSPRPGLRALMAQARIQPETVDAGHLGFAIGPRLNAAGRLSSAQVSYDLLQCDSEEKARSLAVMLEEHNQNRQALLEQALLAADAEATAQVEREPLIFVAGEQYLAGIVGLVAGRLAEQFYRPAIAVERSQPTSRGSCRSIPGFHMAQALDECDDLLLRHGGHAQAAGFTVQTERLPELHERLARLAREQLQACDLEPVIAVDAVVPMAAASWDSLRWLRKLQPFGAGNPAPVLQSNRVRLKAARVAGNKHLRLWLTDGRQTWDGIAFRQGELPSSLKAGDMIDILYNLEEQTWNGDQTLQLIIKDLRASR